MLLSPFAQYCIRKLLRQNIETLASLITSESGRHRFSEKSLEAILNNVYLDPTTATTKVVELELLTKLYQDLEKRKSDEASLVEIKRRIFQILGFRANLALPANLPLIVQEASLLIFRFYHDGSIQNGIHYEHELYGEIRRFDSIHRLQVYQFAWAMLEYQVPLLITVAPSHYAIWVSLRSPSYRILLRHDAAFLRMILFLHSTLHKGKHLLRARFKKPENDLWLS
jgi:hypothetical protein